MGLTFALIGNQNCGKTTLFNQLTGASQHVGNFPGVTVEKKEGFIRRQKGVSVVDLPGIYSLSPYTAEEVVTRDFLTDARPEGIINILDATNIERNLYLTLQLIELNIPMVVALNMMDEVHKSGGHIHIEEMARELGLPVVPICANRAEGIDELVTQALRVAGEKIPPARLDFCSGAVHRCIHAVAHLIEDHAESIGLSPRFAATKLVEGDRPMAEKLALSDNERDMIEHSVSEMESETELDREAALADMRYRYIETLCARTVHKAGETREQIRSEKIDRVLTHKYFAIPAFFLIMLLIFWLTFGVLGAFLSDLFAAGIDRFIAAADRVLAASEINPAVRSLIIDGVFSGVGSVLSFLPTIVLLFFFLSILEDSGYMARVAFVMDKLLRRIGLSGRSFVPMLIGFGCSVPAIMATRTLASERDRKMTIVLTPFMSCSAKLPIYGVFTAAFFPRHGALVMLALYLLGMALAALSGLLMKETVFNGNPVPFVLELPAYRMPSLKNTVLLMWDKAKDFLRKAFTIIFIATVVIWLLQNFDGRFMLVDDSAKSLLASIGRAVSPVFRPLGFGSWEASTALIVGLSAKEAVVSTLAVLTGAGDVASLPAVLSAMFSPAAGFSFLVFTVLYMPCVASFAAIRRELGSLKDAVLAMIYQTSVAWLVAFVFYQVGSCLIGG